MVTPFSIEGASSICGAVQAIVGGTTVLLPVPQGFAEPSKSAPILRRNAEAITAPAMRLLAVFVAEEDRKAIEQGTTPSFKRYFLAQVLRAGESDKLTASEFSEVKSQVTGLDRAALSRVSEDLRKQVGSAAKRVGADAGVNDLALEIGEPRQLGVFHETDSSVSTLLVTRAAASTPARTLERVVAQATSTILLRGKVVFFAAYSEASASSDYEWLRSVSQAWVESASVANER